MCTPSPDDDEPELAGSRLSAPESPNLGAKVAFRSLLDSTGFGRPQIGPPHPLPVEDIPTPIPETQQKHEEGAKQESKKPEQPKKGAVPFGSTSPATTPRRGKREGSAESQEEKEDRMRPIGAFIGSNGEREDARTGEEGEGKSFAEAVKEGQGEGGGASYSLHIVEAEEKGEKTH